MQLSFDSVDNSNYHIFSANEIRTFCDCSRKRYYNSRDLLAIRSTKLTPALSIGTAVHKWLQHMYTTASALMLQRDDFSIEAARDCVQQAAASFAMEIDEDTAKTFNCITSEDNYRKQLAEDLTKYTVLACEAEFQLKDWPFEGVLYHGQIDMIVLDRETQKIHFFEHKTCKDFRPEIYNRFDIQLHIYDVYGRVYASSQDLEWGGMILNEIKKSRTDRGYASHRMYYNYSQQESDEFFNWLSRKTDAAVHSKHEPCNGYMTCRVCDYAPICLKYGYEVPEDRESILAAFSDEEGNPLYQYEPRDDSDED